MHASRLVLRIVLPVGRDVQTEIPICSEWGAIFDRAFNGKLFGGF